MLDVELLNATDHVYGADTSGAAGSRSNGARGNAGCDVGSSAGPATRLPRGAIVFGTTDDARSVAVVLPPMQPYFWFPAPQELQVALDACAASTDNSEHSAATESTSLHQLVAGSDACQQLLGAVKHVRTRARLVPRPHVVAVRVCCNSALLIVHRAAYCADPARTRDTQCINTPAQPPGAELRQQG